MKFVNVKKMFSRICLALVLLALLGSPLASTAEARPIKAPSTEIGDHGGWFDQVLSRLMNLLPGQQQEARARQEKAVAPAPGEPYFRPNNGSIISYTTNNGSCIDPLGRPRPCID